MIQVTKFDELADPRRPLYLASELDKMSAEEYKAKVLLPNTEWEKERCDAFSVPLKTHPEYEQRTKTILPEQDNIEAAQKAQDYPFHNYLDQGLYTAPARALSGVARECSD